MKLPPWGPFLTQFRRAYGPVRQWRTARRDWSAWRRFWQSHAEYNQIAPAGELRPELLTPCLYDATAETQVDPIYFHQDTWAFRKIVAAHPSEHVDVGSHHKFVAFLSLVVPVTMIDLRPLPVALPELQFRQGSILEMPYADGSISSLSSLCVVEHIGLGRYGDPLDPDGSWKAFRELRRVLAPGGNFYFSVPVHEESRTYFNAHRAFAHTQLEEWFSGLQVMERRYITGKEMVQEAPPGFSIGLFHLRALG